MSNRTRIVERFEPRPCFVVVSWEGCEFPDVCQQKHVMVDCEVHGHLARVEKEDTGRGIMILHMQDSRWPKPAGPLTAEVLERITASKTPKNRIFVPSGYRG